MSTNDWARVKQVFHDALELPEPERATFITGACAGDEELLAEVQGLLAAHDDAASPPEAPTMPPGGRDEPPRAEAAPALAEQVGTTIGNYRLLQELGEGGFGVVFVAEQTKPVQRKVALKVIKLGMDTREVVARFEAERQALALMDHPNIARVLDGGATETGRPYFVMELVRGVPITTYCDQNSLGLADRLRLFMDVCHAVQHAHQKGVIHRDIKPANVLVTVLEDRPVPKVIDFGIAKATNARLTEKTVFTEFHQLIGTPEYMSPEQAEMSELDIDTRSDVYSLGVLLYELLTGTTPFDPRKLRSIAYNEIQRIIREEEPPKPSTRLSTLGDSATDIASHRRTDTHGLTRLVRGDLDWVVMKALEKDRTRRYETANAFAGDLERFLAHEPVLAGPPKASYRLRKFARRNRAVLTGVGAVALALVVGLSAAVYGFIDASRERDAKERALDAAVLARDESDAVVSFLAGMLEEADPKYGGRDALVRDVLDNAAQEIRGEFDDQPLVEARLRHTIGETYRSIGAFEQGERHLELAWEIRRRERGDDDRAALLSRQRLGILYYERGHFVSSRDLLIDTLAAQRRQFGEEDQHTLKSKVGLGTAYLYLEQFDEAEPLLLEARDALQRRFGDEHDDTQRAVNNLAGLYWTQQRYDEAEPLFVKTLEIRRRVFGASDPRTVTSMDNLAGLFHRQGRRQEAEALRLEALVVARNALGDADRRTMQVIRNLAELYHDWDRQRWAQSEQLYAESIDLYRRHLPRTKDAIRALKGYGDLLADLRRFGESEAAYLEAYHITEDEPGLDEGQAVALIKALVHLYDEWGKPDKSAEWGGKLRGPSGS